uniref:R3H domain-containing protein n=1 Tax=Pyrodinium bahamense TaxID=73915 RepID=A0A7S0FNZ4_9DINO
MASTVVAEPNSEFEFNPSAPEFIPQQQQQQMMFPEGLHGMSSAFLPAANARSLSAVPAMREESAAETDAQECSVSRLLLVPREDQARRSLSRRRSSMAHKVSATDGGANLSPEKMRRQSARRATNAPEAPSQVATLVVKNLAMDLGKADVMRFLEERGAAAADVDLHRDAGGAFRGTAFARYASPGKARAALEKLGAFPEFGGRKARVEIQKSKALFGRKCLEAGLPQEELGVVREEIECFVNDPSRSEVGLPAGLSVHQRKYAHSLAERHNLVHATRQGENGEKYVYLSKARGEPPDGRKKAHSVANCTGSRHSVGSQGGKSSRWQTFPPAEPAKCDWPPGVEPWPACLDEPDPLGPRGGDTIFTPDTATSALMTSPPICAAPGLPLPPGICAALPRPAPGLEFEGPALQQPSASPVTLPSKAHQTGLDAATPLLYVNPSNPAEIAGPIRVEGDGAEE